MGGEVEGEGAGDVAYTIETTVTPDGRHVVDYASPPPALVAGRWSAEVETLAPAHPDTYRVRIARDGRFANYLGNTEDRQHAEDFAAFVNGAAQVDTPSVDVEQELREKIAYLRAGCVNATREELIARITAVGAAEWKGGDWLSKRLDAERRRVLEQIESLAPTPSVDVTRLAEAIPADVGTPDHWYTIERTAYRSGWKDARLRALNELAALVAAVQVEAPETPQAEKNSDQR